MLVFFTTNCHYFPILVLEPACFSRTSSYIHFYPASYHLLFSKLILLREREGIRMALGGTQKFNLDRICKDFDIDRNRIDNSSEDNFTNTLKSIYDDYILSIPKLENYKAEILDILNKSLKGQVHSIRARIKDADHLIEKIIRNVNEKPDKYHGISVDNYNKIVTDLIGIRIIILNKHDWKDIHSSLLSIFHNDPSRYAEQPNDLEKNYDLYPFYENDVDGQERMDARSNCYHAERPVVYITSEDDRQLYSDEYLKVDTAKKHYRSIHYIIRYGTIYFEIQVRTLFEEGWLEFDHRVKYPYDQSNVKKQEYVEILSSLAVAADRLISFYSEEDFKEKNKKASKTNTITAIVNPTPSGTIQSRIKMKY